MLFWYNNSPNTNGIIPAEATYVYPVRLPGLSSDVDVRDQPENGTPYQVGDIVYVKPVDVKCTAVWPTGTVTAVISNVSVEVDGMPRHVRDIRLAHHATRGSGETMPNETIIEGLDVDTEYSDVDNSDTDSGSNEDISDDNGGANDVIRRFQRNRRPPQWMADFKL